MNAKTKPLAISAAGWCPRCQQEHSLLVEPARQHCLALMGQLAQHSCLDFSQGKNKKSTNYSTEPLFCPGGGKMFGLLSCRDQHGHSTILRAFSGQYNGRWQVPGWAKPLVEYERFLSCTQHRELTIKAISRQMASLPPDEEQRQKLKKLRRQLSAQLMRDIHNLYQLHNFRGEILPLVQVFQGPGLPPTGAGDCCAPKLLQQAALLGLAPESMAEFYWGSDNKAGTRQHGCFYPPCASAARPILGFMLCGGVEMGNYAHSL